MLADVSSTQRAFERVFTVSSVISGRSVRMANWAVCWQMLWDTHADSGSGAVTRSFSRTTTGGCIRVNIAIRMAFFWGLMAHFGVVGLLLYGWFLAAVARMFQQTLHDTRDRGEHAIVWGMAAAIGWVLGLEFVEFSFDEKPFWEFLALLTVCWALGRSSQKEKMAEVSS